MIGYFHPAQVPEVLLGMVPFAGQAGQRSVLRTQIDSQHVAYGALAAGDVPAGGRVEPGGTAIETEDFRTLELRVATIDLSSRGRDRSRRSSAGCRSKPSCVHSGLKWIPSSETHSAPPPRTPVTAPWLSVVSRQTFPSQAKRGGVLDEHALGRERFVQHAVRPGRAHRPWPGHRACRRAPRVLK